MLRLLNTNVLFVEPVPLNRSALIVVFPPTVTLLPVVPLPVTMVAPVCPAPPFPVPESKLSVPPFKLTPPVPRVRNVVVEPALLAAVSVPVVTVVVPVYEVFVPDKVSAEVALFSVTPVTFPPILPLIVVVPVLLPELRIVPVLLTDPLSPFVPAR